jgi:hypothetical protein
MRTLEEIAADIERIESTIKLRLEINEVMRINKCKFCGVSEGIHRSERA